MTNSIGELEDAPFIFAIGTNTTESHPVIALRIKKAVRNGARLVVADPRRIDLTRFAHRYLPLRIGSDIALVSAMCHVILAEGLQRDEYVRERTLGLDELRRHLSSCTPEWAEPITGISADTIREVAREYARAERASICYTLGITEHHTGVANVQALANLALITGNLGRASSGVNPFRGQNNVQGAGDMGAMPDSLPGYQKWNDPAARELVSRVWQKALPEVPGLKKPEAIDAALEGRVRAMWIVGDNTVAADTDVPRTLAALRKLDFLVVQDIFLTHTAREAHVVLPAACFAEVDGTFTNSERRVQRVRKAVEPPGEAKADWWIFNEVSRRMGTPMAFGGPEDIWNEARKCAPPLGGISWARIDRVGLQWPCPTEDHPGTQFLHQDGFPTGKARLALLRDERPAEMPDTGFPLTLTTGRRLSTYHTGTQTGRATHFKELVDREYVEINPDDAREAGIADGELVGVSSRRGAIREHARVSERSPRGVVFLSFAFPEEVLTNLLSSPAVDPVTRTPEFKACAVKLSRLALPG